MTISTERLDEIEKYCRVRYIGYDEDREEIASEPSSSEVARISETEFLAMKAELLALRSPSPPERKGENSWPRGDDLPPCRHCGEHDMIVVTEGDGTHTTTIVKCQECGFWDDPEGWLRSPSPPEGIGAAGIIELLGDPASEVFLYLSEDGRALSTNVDRVKAAFTLRAVPPIGKNLIPLYAAPVPSPAIAEARQEAFRLAAHFVETSPFLNEYAQTTAAGIIRRTAQGGE
jgi:hypothetical protein